jgi:hypothetical protein
VKELNYYRHIYAKRFVSLSLALMLLVLPCSNGAVKASESNRQPVNNITEPETPKARAYQDRPLSFEPNKGQFAPQVKFYGRGEAYDVYIGSTDVSLNLFQSSEDKKSHSLKMKFGDSQSVEASGINQLPGRKNYFIGNDQNRWVKDVPTYSAVRLNGLYKGIDALFYDKDRKLEYDLIAAPGADLSIISIKFEGIDSLCVNREGALVLSTGGKEILSLPPIAFQHIDGVKTQVTARYKIRKDGAVGFEASYYDKTRPLIIDPVIEYSRYLGGSQMDIITDVATYQGDTYVVGYTKSSKFPLDPNSPPDPVSLFSTQAFIVNLDQNGEVEWENLFGSITQNDKALDVYYWGSTLNITGSTEGDDFPIINSTASPQGGMDAFVISFDIQGAILYSRPIGGSGGDEGTGIAMDELGDFYLVGSTTSEDLPADDGMFQYNIGIGAYSTDGYIIKLKGYFSGEITGEKDKILYCSYLGGNGLKVAVSGEENIAFVLGYTEDELPYTNHNFSGISEYFIPKIDTSKTEQASLIKTSFITAAGVYPIGDIKIDPEHDDYLYMCGTSMTQASFEGASGAFYISLSTSTFGVLHLEFIDGSGEDVATGIDFERDQKLPANEPHNVFVTGYTNSTKFYSQTTGDQLPGSDPESKVYGVFGVYFKKGKNSFGTVIGGTDESSFGTSVAHVYEKGVKRFVIVGYSKATDYVTGNPYSVQSPDDKNHGIEDGIVTELELDGFID